MPEIDLVDVCIRDGNQSVWSMTGLDTRQIEPNRNGTSGPHAVAREQACAARAMPSGEPTDDVDAKPIGSIEQAFRLQRVRVGKDHHRLCIVGQLLWMIQLEHRNRAVRHDCRQQTDRRLTLGLLADTDHAAGNDRAGNRGSRKPAHGGTPHGVSLIAEMIRSGDDHE